MLTQRDPKALNCPPKRGNSNPLLSMNRIKKTPPPTWDLGGEGAVCYLLVENLLDTYKKLV